MTWAHDHFPHLFSASRSSLPKRVLISYILDYAILVVLFVVFQALDAVEPYHQHFALQNYTLQYPYAVHERVPIALAFAIAVVAPILVIALYTLVIDGLFSNQSQQTIRRGGGRARYSLQERLWELNCGILGLLLSEGLAFVITGALKNEIGKPRPDLIDRCRPIQGSVDPPVFGLSNSTICTQGDHSILKDGFRSFPSGHSSSAFAGLFYLSLYLAGKLHALDNKGEVWKSFVVVVPSLAASLIAGSRIMDARHHPFDVISGSLLGIVVAWASYRQYFPSVNEPWHKGRAYPIRAWGTAPKVPRHEYRDMSREHSPVELLHVERQPRWDDPEAGHKPSGIPTHSNKPRAQTWTSLNTQSLGDHGGSRTKPSSHRDGESDRVPIHMHGAVSSSSSVDVETRHPPQSDIPRGRAYGRGIGAGHDTFSSSTSSLHSHEVEELDSDMAPRPLSPSKSPERHNEGFSQDTAYHPRPAQSGSLPLSDFSTADDVVESYICGHCGLKLRGEDERRNHVHHAAGALTSPDQQI